MSAVEKLHDLTNVPKAEIETWLEQQPIWQIYLPRPRYIPRPYFDETTKNETHQLDVLYLPSDNGYKYALTAVDIGTRKKDAEPLKNKMASQVLIALDKIYSRKYLDTPNTIQIDPGTEFKGTFRKQLEDRGIKFRVGAPKNHRAQAFVERFNQTLANKLFAHQYKRELTTGKRNKEWVSQLPSVIETLNKTISKPRKPTYKRPIGKEETPLGDVIVRYLYQPGEAEGDEKRRSTDPNWSVDTYRIQEYLVKPNQPIIYFLDGGPKRSFVREELYVVN